MKFDFADDSVSLEKSITEILPMTNIGNAPAKYSWMVPTQQAFTVAPKDGILKRYSSVGPLAALKGNLIGNLVYWDFP